MARYLIDKSALARMTSESVRTRLAPVIETGEAATCAIVDLEVLFSARNHEDHVQIRQRRELTYRRVPMTEGCSSDHRGSGNSLDQAAIASPFQTCPSPLLRVGVSDCPSLRQ
jgi:predicted nucleic acid-binding protein